MVSIKQMNYAKNYEEATERKIKILCDSIYKGYRYIIIDYNGSHPCAYVEIPHKHSVYGKTDKEFWRIGINEVTYGRDHLRDILTDTWVIGWDYAHSGDRSLGSSYGDKHSTFSILEEALEAIEELIQMEE